MNPLLNQLQPYPFEKLKQLFAEVTPNPAYRAISLGIGEPRHPTPPFIQQALADHLDGLATYPTTAGSDQLRRTIADWLKRRYAIPALDPATQILPINGSREALFALAQTVVDGSKDALVVCPNPLYQIYEGAAYLAGAQPYFVNCDPARNFAPDFSSLTPELWSRVQLVYLCSPGNPAGAVLTLDDWRELFELSDRYGFVIAADECYSEIYFNENEKPLGSLEAACKLGRTDYRRLVAFSSLSKRSNVPGMRSGFVAGDADIMRKFLLYRTYHGSAMSPAVQSASIAAWDDEQHVIENRAKYVRKFQQVTPMLQQVLDVSLPDAGFYLWARVDKLVDISDVEFAQRLYAEYNVTVLPGSYLGREAHGVNPGHNRVRMALVAEVGECLEAAQRIVEFVGKLAKSS